MKFERKIYQVFGLQLGRPLSVKLVIYAIFFGILEIIIYNLPVVGNLINWLPFAVLVMIPIGLGWLLSDVGTENRSPIFFFRSFFAYQKRKWLDRKVLYRGRAIPKDNYYQFRNYLTYRVPKGESEALPSWIPSTVDRSQKIAEKEGVYDEETNERVEIKQSYENELQEYEQKHFDISDTSIHADETNNHSVIEEGNTFDETVEHTKCEEENEIDSKLERNRRKKERGNIFNRGKRQKKYEANEVLGEEQQTEHEIPLENHEECVVEEPIVTKKTSESQWIAPVEKIVVEEQVRVREETTPKSVPTLKVMDREQQKIQRNPVKVVEAPEKPSAVKYAFMVMRYRSKMKKLRKR